MKALLWSRQERSDEDMKGFGGRAQSRCLFTGRIDDIILEEGVGIEVRRRRSTIRDAAENPVHLNPDTYSYAQSSIEIMLDGPKRNSPQIRGKMRRVVTRHLRDTKTLCTVSTATSQSKSSHDGAPSSTEVQKRKSFRDRFMKSGKDTNQKVVLDEQDVRDWVTKENRELVNQSTEKPLSASSIFKPVSFPLDPVPEKQERRRGRSRSRERSRSKSRVRKVIEPLICQSKAVDEEFIAAMNERIAFEPPASLSRRPAVKAGSKLPVARVDRENEKRKETPSMATGGGKPMASKSSSKSKKKDVYLERKPSSIVLSRIASHISDLSIPGELDRERSVGGNSIAQLRDTLHRVEYDLRYGRDVSRSDILKSLRTVAVTLDEQHRSSSKNSELGRLPCGRGLDSYGEIGFLDSYCPYGSERERRCPPGDSSDSSESEPLSKAGSESPDDLSDDISEFTRWVDELERGSHGANDSFLAEVSEFFKFSVFSKKDATSGETPSSTKEASSDRKSRSKSPKLLDGSRCERSSSQKKIRSKDRFDGRHETYRYDDSAPEPYRSPSSRRLDEALPSPRLHGQGDYYPPPNDYFAHENNRQRNPCPERPLPHTSSPPNDTLSLSSIESFQDGERVSGKGSKSKIRSSFDVDDFYPAVSARPRYHFELARDKKETYLEEQLHQHLPRRRSKSLGARSQRQQAVSHFEC